MHPSLWLLTKLQLGASLRKLRRSLKSVRGVLMLLFVVGIFGSMILPGIMVSRGPLQPSGFINDYGACLLLAYLLILLLTSAGEKAISFSPSEVDFLFPAPFSRRQLIAFKIFNTLLSLACISLFVAGVNRVYYHLWIAGAVGFFLTLAFIQLLTLLTALIQQTVTQASFTRTRRIVATSIIVAVAFAAGHSMMSLSSWQTEDFAEIYATFRQSPIANFVLAPFQVFCNAICAERLFPEFAIWGGIAAAINGLLLLAIFALDANFNEAAIRIGKLKYDRIQKMQSGGAMIKSSGRSTQIPMLPFFSGAGPMLWRQLVRSLRGAKRMIILGLLICCAFGVPFFMREFKLSERTPWMVIGIMAYLTFLMLVSMPSGFRIDVMRIETFKSLPLPDWAICLGELLAPAAMVTCFHWSVLIVMALLMPNAWPIWLTAFTVSPLLNLLILSVSNGLFLLYPVKIKVGTTPDPSTLFKTMLAFVIQAMAIGLVLPVVALPSGLVYLFSNSVIAAVATALLFLAGTVAIGLLFVRAAYRRFDVSKHLPS